MDDSLRKGSFYTLSVKGNFESLAKFPGNIQLFDRFSFHKNFYDNSGIAKIVNAQKLRRFQDVFFPIRVIRQLFADFIHRRNYLFEIRVISNADVQIHS